MNAQLPMSDDQILARVALALAIGFLIGLERGWQTREEGEGERAAGLRTFTLIALAGALWALLGQLFGEATFAAGFIAVAAVLAVFRWREAVHEGSYGATTVVAGLLAFGLGAYAIVGSMTVAAAGGVATAAILAAKRWLHAWVRKVTWQELRASLILAAMSFVALPLLPDRGYGPYGALNLHDLWLMTIAVAGVSFIGYVALKLAGMRFGMLVAGVAGGVVSSTVTTLDMARRARAGAESRRFLLAGAFAAAATMFLRVGAIVAVFGPALLPYVGGPLGAALVVAVIAAVVFDRPWQMAGQHKDVETNMSNPFEVRFVFGFGALLAVIFVLSTVSIHAFGGRGGVVLAAIAGLGDVDAITLSMTRSATGVSPAEAALAVLTATVANSFSKSALAIAIGGLRFGVVYSAVTAAAIVVGAVVAAFQPWS